ncbi:MAG TPA: Hsp20/alpha crystallin family protein [Candidatus Nanoarchaeia archaeon]|nr:Hsp20/alpha crystallin family protein [Candidatus Nanoarchaeia archaeon]
MKERRSFFERLTGAMRVQDDTEEEETSRKVTVSGDDEYSEAIDVSDGELMVDVYQTPTDIVIKTMVPGVRPEDLDITITRDVVTIKGKREVERSITNDNYFHKELYWGSFSRTITLPQEVEIEESEAVEKHGLLIIRLPKLDKHRQSKLRVRNN